MVFTRRQRAGWRDLFAFLCLGSSAQHSGNSGAGVQSVVVFVGCPRRVSGRSALSLFRGQVVAGLVFCHDLFGLFCVCGIRWLGLGSGVAAPSLPCFKLT